MAASILLGFCILFGCGESQLRCGPNVGVKQLDFQRFAETIGGDIGGLEDIGASVTIRCHTKIMPTWEQQFNFK